MKLYDFIRRLDYLDICRNCDDPSTINCVAYIPRRKRTVGYPITSITVTSTVKNTRVILNAEYETSEGRDCIKLDRLYEQLKDLYKYLDGHERRGSIYITIKKSSNSNKIAYTIPTWRAPSLDLDQEALFIKCTNSFVPKD